MIPIAHNGPLHLALRDVRRELSRPQALSVLAGIAIVLAVIGPFETDVVLRFVPRLVYWVATVALTYAAGHLATGLIHRSPARALPRIPLLLVTAAAIGVAASLVVLALNAAAFGILPAPREVGPFLLNIFAISLVITTVYDIFERAQSKAKPDTTAPLMDRLPLDKRGPLVALSVQDHYVNIRTTNGTQMVLMRLSDAIREVGATQGLQIHRSHWVALGAVTSVTRQGDKATVALSHGPALPASRANLPKLRQAGLLPR